MEIHSSILDSCLENPYGQRSRGRYSPLGGKESDTNEQLRTTEHVRVCVYCVCTHTCIHIHTIHTHTYTNLHLSTT